MQQGVRRLAAVVVALTLWACSAGSGSDCIKMTPTSRRCSSPQRFAEPPPPAQVPAAVAASSWTLTTADRSVPGNPSLREAVWTVARPPYGQYDFVTLRRIAPLTEGTGPTTGPVFLFLPGAHLHGEIIFTEERYDLRMYLANRGSETWTLDYRTHFVSRDQIYDSNFMRSWTAEAFVEDVAAAAHFVREMSGTQKIFVGGFSHGATLALLAAARSWREDLLGIVVLDGYVLAPPDVDLFYRERTPTPNWFADDVEGRYMPYKRWMKILQDTIADPSGPDFLPVPVFANRAEALAHFLYVNRNFGAQGGLSNAKEGYADVLVLARVFQHQDRYWPRVQNHGGFDYQRHLAGTQFDYVKALTSMNVPIIAFSSGNMDKAGIPWSEAVEYSARITATTDVEHHLLNQWGHLDVLWGASAAQQVFHPIVDWLKRHNTTVRP